MTGRHHVPALRRLHVRHDSAPGPLSAHLTYG